MFELWPALAHDMPWLAYGLIGLLGLCVGSFLNVVIYRMPLMMEQMWRQECQLLLHPDQDTAGMAVAPAPAMTLSRPASSCPACGHRIRWYENIPVLSWISLRGRCRACHQPIGWRYPAVELITALLSMMVFWKFGASWQLLSALGFTWVLIALTGIDFDKQLLPDRLTLPLAGAGLLVSVLGIGLVSPDMAIWGYIAGFLCLWVVYVLFKLLTGKEGMGYGDFKLLAAMGAWLGPGKLLLIILLSSLVGSVIGLILMRLQGQSRAFAFGPYLAIAGWIALIFGDQIIRGYQAYLLG